MNRRTPIATALLALFAAPAAWSQQAASADVVSAVAATATTATTTANDLLLAQTTPQRINVDGSRDDGFNVGATSISKLPADLKDVPQSITVLDKSLLNSQGATSLSDALRNVPGITLGGAEGGQIGNNININGFTARTDIYLDGFRDRGQYYRDTFALDAVEVLMGPSSMLFGRGSTGGVINQVSKLPKLKDFTEVSASVTTNGLVRTTIDTNHPLGDQAAFRVAAFAQDGKPTTRDEMKNKDYGLDGSLRFGIGTRDEITLSALLQHNRDMPDYGVSPLNGHPVQVDRNAFYGFTSDRTIQDVIALSAALNHTISPDMKIRSVTAYNDVRVNAVETASQSLGTLSSAGAFLPLPTVTSPTPTTPTYAGSLGDLLVRLQSHDRLIHDKSLSNQTEWSANLATGAIRHSLLAGGELDHDTYSNQGFYRNGECNNVAFTGTSGYAACEPLIDPTYAATPANAPSHVGNLSTSKANDVAVYLTDTAEITPQIKLVGGLRHDRFQANIENTITSATVPARVDQTVSFNSVRAGAIWQPSTAQSYYASYSTSFNPSLEQLTNTTGGTAPLPPEENKSYEVGGKWDALEGKASFNAAAFQITQDNARSSDATGLYTATGTIRVNGARVGASGLLARGWKIFAGYSYLDAEIVDGIAVGTNGKVPLNTPRNSASLWSTYEFAPHWEAGGGATYMSSRFVNNTDLVSVPGYARLDATLAYRQPKYDIRLNLFNLTNKYYYDALIQSDGGRSVPGTGRSGMLTFTYHL